MGLAPRVKLATARADSVIAVVLDDHLFGREPQWRIGGQTLHVALERPDERVDSEVAVAIHARATSVRLSRR